MSRLFSAFLMTILFSSTVFAKGFVGKVGPFPEKKFVIRTFQFKVCDPSLKKLVLDAPQLGRYHHPRVQAKGLVLRYSDNSEQTLDLEKIGVTRGFVIPLQNLPVCLASLTIEAEGLDFRPASSLPTWLNVWVY